MSLCCQQDERRDAVRRMNGRNGLDYVEVSNDQRTLTVFFLGKLPPEFTHHQRGAPQVRIEGGRRVTDIQVTGVAAVVDPDPEKDDSLVVSVDKYGDFSTYTLRLIGVENIDPRYDHVEFSFKIDCRSDVDCVPACECAPPTLVEPEINYLAKDYGSFRQLILDRLSLLMPEWKERHVPDLGIALVELLAYTGDYLSYYQDAVGTETYLDTARERISVRRHVRLVDYRLHQGCNARAWVCVEVSDALALNPAETAFVTGLNDALRARPTVLSWDALREVPAQAYEVFEPLLAADITTIQLRPAHNEIHFYTWGEKQCCIERGSTSATLLDSWRTADRSSAGKPGATNAPPPRALQLEPGDVLIFEEVLGAKTGLPADADPTRRHAVRLTRVTPGQDALLRTSDGEPTPYVEVEWSRQDALPFPFCISTIGAAPECSYLENVSVVRGNVILVDHGKTQGPDDLGRVDTSYANAACDCADHPGDVEVIPRPFRACVRKTPLTFRQLLPADGKRRRVPASQLLSQDVRAALPQIRLISQPAAAWEPRYDLIDSEPNDRHFVVEIDNLGVAHLRFGDGEMGYQPPAGMSFGHPAAGMSASGADRPGNGAVYRVGNGARGNVGAESISRLVLKNLRLDGVSVTVRNPLAARGGTDPEPIAEAKLFAPRAFRKQLERAIIADDYEHITEGNPEVQRASAALVWTGSWYEADVALDPVGREGVEPGLLGAVTGYLHRFRRMGHDLRVTAARYVPLDVKLEVCVLPHYQRGHVKAALLDAFSNRTLAGGQRGFFHPDNLTFGEGIYVSKIIAVAQAVQGVEAVVATRFQRLFEPAHHEIANGLLPLRTSEIAQLDNDPNYPEHGKLEIQARGGR